MSRPHRSFSLSFLIATGIVIVVVATTVLIGVVAVHGIRKSLMQSRMETLESETRRTMDRFWGQVEETRASLMAISHTPPIQGIIRARQGGGVDALDGSREDQWRARLGEIFRGYLQANPHVAQIRYIGVADNGRELVRGNSLGSAETVEIVPEARLAEKGDRDYFQQAVAAPPDSVVYSGLEFNREGGRISEPRLPILRLATPIYVDGVSDELYGILIVNLNLEIVCSLSAKLLEPHSQLYLYDDRGEYLFHRDRHKVFGFESGQPGLAFTEFPMFEEEAKRADADRSPSTVQLVLEERNFAAAHLFRSLSPTFGINAIVTWPMSELAAPIRTLQRSVLLGGVGALFVGMVLALVIAHRISGPVEAMVERLEKYDFRGTLKLPVVAIEEIGLLSASIEALTGELDQKRRALLDETQERARADARAEAKSMFLANMSHEIRTPMNGVMGVLRMLETTSLDAEQREFTGIIQRSAQQLLTVIDDILDFSKIEAGKLSIDRVAVSPSQIVSDVAALMQEARRTPGVKVLTWTAPDLVQCVEGDPVRLRQVLTNLMSNALKFTKEGHVLVSLSSRQTEGDEVTVRFEVEDTGIGIPQDRLEAIFESFSQAESSTTRRFGGTGLGLTICKHLIEMMGGRIGVESEVGKGSTFWFEIDTRVAQCPHAAQNGADSMAGTLVGRMEVLVAEDNSVNKLVSRAALNHFGVYPDFASNGIEVLEMLTLKQYDLVLMDCHMPEMDGFEATQEIRHGAVAGCAEIPIVALSASALDTDRELGLKAGMDDYLSKPIRPEQLYAILVKYARKA